MARVVIENLEKIYFDRKGADVRAVNRINLTVEPGEFMVVVGPSGCGKSTTLRMIAGLEEISGGTVTIGDRVVNDVEPKDRDIAMVFQNYALYPHLSVYDNLAFGLKLRKFPPAEIDRRVREAAALLSLEPYLGRRPAALSGGQRQRVAVGRAIVRRPKVFLFDEPLSNLDAQMRATTRTEIARLHGRLGATMIYVTHDQVEAMTMGDRICVMKDGDIMQVAPPLTLYHEPANLFVASFIGSPPMNLFAGEVRRVATGLEFVAGNASARPVVVALGAAWEARAASFLGRRVVLGIRPENIRPAVNGEPRITARVELAETTGAETHLHLDTGAATFVARVAPRERHERGRELDVTFDAERLHLFDAISGRAIR